MRLTRAVLLMTGVAGALVLASFVVQTNDVAWERRVQRALAQADSLQRVADSARGRADSLAAVRARVQTIVVRRTDSVRVVDSISPPPPDCAPNLAARDSVIASQRRELALDDQLLGSQEVALGALQRITDSLRVTLQTRPHRSLFLGRNLSAGFYYDPISQRAGIGLSLNLGGIRLP